MQMKTGKHEKPALHTWSFDNMRSKTMCYTRPSMYMAMKQLSTMQRTKVETGPAISLRRTSGMPESRVSGICQPYRQRASATNRFPGHRSRPGSCYPDQWQRQSIISCRTTKHLQRPFRLLDAALGLHNVR